MCLHIDSKRMKGIKRGFILHETYTICTLFRFGFRVTESWYVSVRVRLKKE